MQSLGLTVQAPSNLSVEGLARALYPEVFQRLTLERARYWWRTLLRTRPLLQWPSPGVTEQALAKQRMALELALDSAFHQANSLYFVEGGWPEVHLQSPDRSAGIWYFIAKVSAQDEDARGFKVRDGRPVPGRLFSEDQYLALWLPSDDVPVRLRLSRDVAIAYEGSKFFEYEGPASGLLMAARNHLKLALRVSVPAAQ